MPIEEVDGEGEQRRPPRRGLLVRELPDVARDEVVQAVEDRGQEGDGEGDGAVTGGGDEEEIEPVREVVRLQVHADEGAEGPEDEAVDQVNGEDVGEDVLEDLDAQDLLDDTGEFDEDLEADGEDDAVEFGDVVLWVACRAGLGDGEAGGRVWVNAVFEGRVVHEGPLGGHVEG